MYTWKQNKTIAFYNTKEYTDPRALYSELILVNETTDCQQDKSILLCLSGSIVIGWKC